MSRKVFEMAHSLGHHQADVSKSRYLSIEDPKLGISILSQYRVKSFIVLDQWSISSYCWQRYRTCWSGNIQSSIL